MKVWNSEFVYNYKNAYSFGYCLYAQAEEEDHLEDLYARGYLPYSNASNVQNVFYMCRSLRVKLDGFCLSSENRRIYKQFDGKFIVERCSVSLLREDLDVQNLFLDYFKKIHGPSIMPKTRYLHILDHIAARDITLYYENTGKPVACVLHGGGLRSGLEESLLDHYWFSTYCVDLHKRNMGVWLMIDSVVRAQTEGREYMYLGTAYGNGGKYKTNFNNLEWWEGHGWCYDSKARRLRELIKDDSDKEVMHTSRWQEQMVGF